MKKLVILLLTLALIAGTALTACSKGDETDSATVAENSTTGSSESKETDPPAGGDETDPPAGGDETDPPAGGDETDPPAGGDDEPGFDFTAPWDGVSACIKWYDEGGRAGYKISNAYDFAGFSVMVNNPGKPIYFDSEFMVITDTDGDNDLSDEEGYDPFNVCQGEKFAGLKLTLEADIDLNGKAFVPIGIVGSSFQGTFDGQGHTVSNFKIIASDAAKHPSTQTPLYFGLFVCIHNAKVQNLTIDNMTMDVDIATDTDYRRKYL